jgi:hypothetical protein
MAKNVLTTVEFPVDLHRRIKGYAGLKGKTMKDLIIDALYDFANRIENERQMDDDELLANYSEKNKAVIHG